jgi:formimidoylglutamate deiminase
MNALFADYALLQDGWARNVRLVWDAAGILTEVRPGATPGKLERAAGAVLPGIPNLHSHAFQRAMVGLTEHRTPGRDDFWSWRETMYRFALQIEPDALEAIATQLYIEMLKCGYTSVCEFHYLHRDRDGRPYANRIEMSERLIAAAEKAGIGLTLLPVLYEHSGFGMQPLRPEQRRFVGTPEALLEVASTLRRTHPEHKRLRHGIAPHSLRAVSPDSLRRLMEGLNALDASAPIHIHVAEQRSEVADSLVRLGARPVAWLLDTFEVGARWCLVHATHMNAEESKRAAASSACVGLCPSTEANLGDGVFDAATYLAAGGRWGIGSDSHVGVSAREELRWLEYAQRLVHAKRNVLAHAEVPRVAERLFLGAVAGGAQASGRKVHGLAAGQCADLLVLDASASDCCTGNPAAHLSAWVFGSHGNHGLRDVMVGARWVVQDGHHAREEAALSDYRRVREALIARVGTSSC